jgi:hypothetical protein
MRYRPTTKSERTIGIGLVVGIGVGGCNRPSPHRVSATTTTIVSADTGYLASGTGFVDFIQWRARSGKLTGTAQTVTSQGSAPNITTNNETLTLSGDRKGSQISLSFDSGPLTFGTIIVGSFSLEFPEFNGTLAPVTFDPASAQQYNGAVSRLISDVGQTNQAVINAQAQAQAAAAAGAAAAKASAVSQAAIPACAAVGGSLATQPSSLECTDIPYIGSDGSTYYSGVLMNSSVDTLTGPMDTDGTGANEQECTSSYYPNLSTGPGEGPKGSWNSVLEMCLPAR